MNSANGFGRVVSCHGGFADRRSPVELGATPRLESRASSCEINDTAGSWWAHFLPSRRRGRAKNYRPRWPDGPMARTTIIRYYVPVGVVAIARVSPRSRHLSGHESRSSRSIFVRSAVNVADSDFVLEKVPGLARHCRVALRTSAAKA